MRVDLVKNLLHVMVEMDLGHSKREKQNGETPNLPTNQIKVLDVLTSGFYTNSFLRCATLPRPKVSSLFHES